MAGKRGVVSVPPLTVEDRLGAVEERLDTVQTELSHNLEAVKGELQSSLQQQWASIMECLDRLSVNPGGGKKPGKAGSDEVTVGQNETPARSATRSGVMSSEARIRRLELPVFEGLNLDGWIFRAERYFSVYRLTEMEKLEAAVISLDGEALAYFQWADGRRPIESWPELRIAILNRFRESQEGSSCEKLLALHQDGSVRVYCRRFVMLAAPLTDVPETVLEGSFVNGLRSDIRAEI